MKHEPHPLKSMDSASELIKLAEFKGLSLNGYKKLNPYPESVRVYIVSKLVSKVIYLFTYLLILTFT